MPKPSRLPGLNQPQILDEFNLRLIRPEEPARCHALLRRFPYLKNAGLAGAQL
jgi:hypothetical protein